MAGDIFTYAGLVLFLTKEDLTQEYYNTRATFAGNGAQSPGANPSIKELPRTSQTMQKCIPLICSVLFNLFIYSHIV